MAIRIIRRVRINWKTNLTTKWTTNWTTNWKVSLKVNTSIGDRGIRVLLGGRQGLPGLAVSIGIIKIINMGMSKLRKIVNILAPEIVVFPIMLISPMREFRQ